jgi:hypothetical protein
VEANEACVGLAFSTTGDEDGEDGGGNIRSQLVDMVRELRGADR